MRFVLASFFSVGLMFSQPPEQHPTPPPAQAPAPVPATATPPAVEKLSTTQHVLNVNGTRIPYTATAGTLVLKKEDGTPRASMFFVSYSRDDKSDKAKWPITYSFNGGPGSASVWLHLGALGPRRVKMGPEGEQPVPPYQLVDNEDTALAFTDLCFIDPVSTGFSRPAPGENAQQFHGFDGDIESVAAFIRLWTTRFDRWASPKYLAGESYGTTRAAGLSGYLQQRYGMYLNGIILISAILNFETAEFDTGNDLPYILYLPTYTAIAWYHKKLLPDLQGDLQKAVDESRRFAVGEYADALMAGDALPATKHNEITQKLARLTGLSSEYIELTNQRIEIQRFTKQLLRNERRTTGRIDARFLGIDRDAAGEHPEFDPSIAAIIGPYSGMLNDYVRNELKFDSDLPYEVLTGRVRPWNYAPYENRYVNVAETLRSAMTQNPFLHVFVAKGYYDLATPFFAADYTFDHLGLDPTLRGHLSGAYYEAGHMMYVHPASLTKLKADIAQFIKSSAATGPAK